MGHLLIAYGRYCHELRCTNTIAEDHDAASYQLTYGGWIKTLRRAGLVIDDLIEPRPEPGMRNGYMETDPPDWTYHWPAEMLWITRKP